MFHATAAPPLSMTEVLFAVPQGDAGDANKDGKRSATADEFVEIANTSTKDIDLKGWTLVDSDSWSFLTDKGKVAWSKAAEKLKHDGKDWVFVFPLCTLKAGERAVVFNGFEQSPKGPSGSHAAAAERNKDFDRALIFTMKVETSKVALGNDGDWVALISPEGKFVELVKWGKHDVAPPSEAKVTDAPAEPKGSVQRDTAGGAFVDHQTLGDKDRLFSPGEFKASTPDSKKPAKPDLAPAEPAEDPKK